MQQISSFASLSDAKADTFADIKDVSKSSFVVSSKVGANGKGGSRFGSTEIVCVTKKKMIEILSNIFDINNASFALDCNVPLTLIYTLALFLINLL